MIRFAKSSLLLAVLSITCWAQFKLTGIVPTRNHPPAAPAKPNAGSAASATTPFNGIQYNGGPVMNDPHGTNVYYIWYGNWSNDSAAQTILTNFIKNIGGTAYFNINSSYYDYNPGGEKDPVVNRVNYGGSIVDNYSRGSALSYDDVGCIIQNAATSGKLLFDLNGQYFVLTSADVLETDGFCTSFCAFHGYQSVVNSCGQPVRANQLGQNLIGSLAGNPQQCPSSCSAQSVTPNNDFAADSMANLIAHELSESATDPYLTAWVNPDGTENGDLCAWTFGNYKPLSNGSFYNVKFGGRPWLIQQIWVNARGGYCALALDE